MLGASEKGKDNFALNPRKLSSRDLSLFNFLGVLMGICIRTNTNLAVNLPSLVWKQLVGQRLSMDDIAEFDEGIITELNGLLNATEDEFENQFSERYFTTRLSDQSIISLEEGGANKPLTFENRVEYVKKVLYARMTECET
jgi:other hect domain ubiquitin protein ligase E3